MAKVNIELDTKDILDLIDVGDIVDALSFDIENGDSLWWADKFVKPVTKEIIKLINDKNSDFHKELVQALAYRISEDFDFKPVWNKLIEERISKILKL